MRLIIPRRNLMMIKLKNKVPKPLLFPTMIELQYQHDMIKLVDSWKPLIDESTIEYIKYHYIHDSWQDDLKKFVEDFKGKLNSTIEGFSSTINNTAYKVLDWNKRQWDKHTKSVIKDTLITHAPNKRKAIERFTERQNEKINSLVTMAENRLKDSVTKSLPEGNIFEIDLEPLKSSAKKYATLGISEFGTELYKDSQQSMGIDEYIWRTRKDERVRSDHRPLEGKICSWNDPTIFKYSQNSEWLSKSLIGGVMLHTGEDYNCRCWPEANFNSIF